MRSRVHLLSRTKKFLQEDIVQEPHSPNEGTNDALHMALAMLDKKTREYHTQALALNKAEARLAEARAQIDAIHHTRRALLESRIGALLLKAKQKVYEMSPAQRKVLRTCARLVHFITRPRFTTARVHSFVARKSAQLRRLPDQPDFARVNAPVGSAKRLDLQTATHNASRWCTDIDPDISIVIVNRNAAPLTLECIRQIFANTEGYRYEIIVVDNGSQARHTSPFRDFSSGVRFLELGTDRFFGEANNIAAEVATGKWLCVLKNNASVQPGWLYNLIATFDDPEVGAAGPLLLFPDGSIQEAGASVDTEGNLKPLSSGRPPTEICQLTAGPVDYISAVCLLLRRDLFVTAGGFDLAYEPAYYEDIDLCFKIKTLGKSIYFCPRAEVIQLATRSGGDTPAAEMRTNALKNLNKDKFVARWNAFLQSREASDLVKVPHAFMPDAIRAFGSQNDVSPPRKTAALVTAYSLAPGGGERYVLTLASLLCATHDVTLITPYPYSQLRLRNFEREFAINLTACRMTTCDAFFAGPPADFMLTMGNHIVPPFAAHADHAVFLCQFPFKMNRALPDDTEARLSGYRSIVSYSEYSKAHTFVALSANFLPPLKIEVIQPPVQPVRGNALAKQNIILSVGRFFVGAHSKRHDLLIAAFRTLLGRCESGLELHLAGSSVPEPAHMDYLNRLRDMAKGLPVYFHINASEKNLASLYERASVYWHGAGLEADLVKYPETAEHFGMSVVEAMSAACVPIAFNAGGPREIITHQVSGFLYNTIADLVSITEMLFTKSRQNERELIASNAQERAKAFSISAFEKKVKLLIAR